MSRAEGFSIANRIGIEADPWVVFDFVTDLAREQEWNPKLIEAVRLTHGPPGVGARYRLRMRGSGWVTIEYTGYERPRAWSSEGISSRLRVESVGSVAATGSGCELVIQTELVPRGMLRLAAPVLRRVVHRHWDENLHRIKLLLEGAEPAGPGSRGHRGRGRGRSMPRRRPTGPAQGDEQLPTDSPTGGRVQRVPVPDLCTLWAETTTTPMHLALAGTVDAQQFRTPDGSVDPAAIRALVAGHLDRTPMLRRVLVRPPVGFGGPLWADARSFRVEDHVSMVAPEPDLADLEEFWSWCAARSLLPLDRSRPLWRLDIVPELPDGRLGMLIVVHHVIADGVRGAAMLMRLLDTDPAAPHPPPGTWRPATPPGLLDLAKDRVKGGRALGGVPAVLAGLRGARSLRLERTLRAPVTVLGGRIGPVRHVQVIHVPVESVRALAHSQGCTINDLLLAAVAAGLHRFLSDRGQCPPELVLQATVPVGAVDGKASGMMVIPLPVGSTDPAQRLRRVVAETAQRKAKPDEGIAGIVVMPRLLARLGVLWARRTASAHISLYVTNVPGPPTPLYLGGAALRTVVPIAPLVAGVRLSVTALSYAGSLAVTFLGDDHVGELQALADAAAQVLGAGAPRTSPGPSGRH